jgi:hypothetical protein
VGPRLRRGSQDGVAVAAAGGDDLRICDRDVVQFVADDRIDVAHQFAAEYGKLDVALSERPVGEEQFGHCRYLTPERVARDRSNGRRLRKASQARFF